MRAGPVIWVFLVASCVPCFGGSANSCALPAPPAVFFIPWIDPDTAKLAGLTPADGPYDLTVDAVRASAELCAEAQAMTTAPLSGSSLSAGVVLGEAAQARLAVAKNALLDRLTDIEIHAESLQRAFLPFDPAFCGIWRRDRAQTAWLEVVCEPQERLRGQAAVTKDMGAEIDAMSASITEMQNAVSKLTSSLNEAAKHATRSRDAQPPLHEADLARARSAVAAMSAPLEHLKRGITVFTLASDDGSVVRARTSTLSVR